MKRNVLAMGVVVICCTLLFFGAFPSAASRGQDRESREPKAKQKESNRSRKQPQRRSSRPNALVSSQLKLEEDNPDMPKDRRAGIDEQTFHRLRDEYISLRRGIEPGKPHDPSARGRAVRQLEQQEAIQIEKARASLHNRLRNVFGLEPEIASWTAIGPAVLPNGSAQGGGSVRVTGRATAVVVDPTNSNKVYLGTAQGGVWRSLDGGTTWTSIFDNAQSLAIGSLALAPSNPTILYVGTGEFHQCGDCFFGAGLYRIDNVDTSATLVGPINPSITTGNLTFNVFNGRAISKVLVHPTDPATIFVTTGRGIGGSGANSAGIVPTIATRGLYRSTNATAAAAAVTFQKITINTDNSADFPPTGNADVADAVMEPDNPDNLIVSVIGLTGTNGGIYRTTNAQSPTPTFTQSLALPVAARANLTINKIGAVVTLYAATSETPTGGPTCTSGSGAVRKSVDGGITWSSRLPGGGGFCGGQCFYDIAIAVDPNDANVVFLGGSARGTCADSMKKSTNGGTTFLRDDSGLHADTHGLFFDLTTTPSTVYTVNDGGVWKRPSNAGTGSAWTNLNHAPLNTLQFQSVAVHPTDQFMTIGGTQDNGTSVQQSSSGNWINAEGGDGGYALIDQTATDTTNVTMYHTFFNRTGAQIGFDRIVNTACLAIKNSWPTRGDFGFPNDLSPSSCDGTPNLINNGISRSDNVLFYAPMALGPGIPNTVYFGSDRLYRSTDRGDSMIVVSPAPVSGTSPISTIAISPQDEAYRIIGLQNGQVWATSSASSSLRNITSGAFPANPNGSITNRFVGRAIFDPNNKNVAYVAFSFFAAAGQGLWKITNLGAAAGPSPVAPIWTPAGNGIPSVPINALAIDPGNSNNLFAGTDIGVYNSTDGGANWAPYGSGFPRVAVFDLAIQPTSRIIRAATHGRGIWEITIGAPAPVGSVQFTSGGQAVSETLDQTTQVDITVNRTGDSSTAATIDYATSDGSASERSDYLAGVGTIRFEPGQTTKSFPIFIVDDRLGEAAETFNVTLSDPVNCSIGAPGSFSVTINSNEATNGLNPAVDASFNTDFFVRQHYLDFFNRAADAPGLAFWKNQIDECTTQSCREIRRINVSAAFFVSIEFQETGYLVYKTYQAAFNTGELLRLRDFLADQQEIGRGVVIGQPGALEQLEANKQRFFADFVQRPEFLAPAAFPITLTATQFVDKLNSNTFDPGNPGAGALSQEERDALIAMLQPSASSPTLRAQVLRAVAENGLFSSRQFNKAFVLMQYFGYLRRNPNDPPEPGLDFAGYNFWLSKLNQFNGNYIEAEMVKAFITSFEYLQRFGP